MDIAKRICIISFHVKGFWQADVYEEDGDESPTSFCTGKKGDDMFGVINKTSKRFPGIEFHQGITGICDECQAEYIYNETECTCGGHVNDPC